MIESRRFRFLFWGCVALACFTSSQAVGQNIDLGGNDSPNILVQNFQPIAGPHGIFTLESSQTALDLEVVGGLMLNFAQDPLVLNIEGRTEPFPIVKEQLAADLLFVLGLFDIVEIGLDLPIYLINNAAINNNVIEGATIGDLKIRPKLSFLSSESSPVGFAVYTQVDLPTGDDQAFASTGSFGVRPGVIVDTRVDKLLLALNLATDLKGERAFGDVDISNQLALGLGAQYEIVDSTLYLGGELISEASFDDFFKEEETPLEGLVGLKMRTQSGLNFELGGGGGIVGGIGTPSFRIFGGVRYANYDADLDGDGIFNSVDACPHEAEDRDLFKDEDGCPEDDNDEDGLLDENDTCPNEPEDKDQFQDEDGCPDPDNDKDTVLDGDDGCPNEAEDLDGFEDKDGCPEDDNDRDGIPDAQDQCPDEAETLNGIDDEDGCPDEDKGKAIVDIKPDKKEIFILQRVFFDTGKSVVLGQSFALLNAVALTLKGNPEIELVEVQGHTDDRGDDTYNLELSSARANAVRDFLIKKGVSPSRLSAKGYGESDPATPIEKLRGKALDEARGKNRRVQFKILKKK